MLADPIPSAKRTYDYSAILAKTLIADFFLENAILPNEK